eukprot:TRINITY_DN1177_c0_g1_i2.p1 TRINITY_DN1177_c0_g1~~TRINITY_DN1177_c0_g1_i2.p1  ORF type:complete len:535 (+),score=122.08 TRINITY_DN1177_c0_g1_i2:106-1710(+)
MDSIGGLYNQLVNAIIRPPRFEYDLEDLGSPDFRLGGRQYFRKDVELKNSRGHSLQCSLYAPIKRPKKLPCVIYCHGNSGCRLDAQDAVRILLPMNIMVFAFDFSGCGLSSGEWVSLGFYERDDLRCIIDYLRKHVTRIALWGRSMGAVTSIMYSAEDPSVSCCVVDSPFSSLRTLAMELVDKMAAKLPSLVAKAGYKMVRSSVKKQAKFDIDELETIKSAQASYVPALFGHGEDDTFIAASHSKTLHEAYAGDKNVIYFEGDHNSRRPQFFLDSVSIFIRNYLLSKTDFGSDNPLPSGESFDDYFSPTSSDSFDDLDNISMLNMLAESFYSRQKEDSTYAPTNADEEDEQLRQAILLSMQSSELETDEVKTPRESPPTRKDRNARNPPPIEVEVALDDDFGDDEAAIAAAVAAIDAKHAEVNPTASKDSGGSKKDKKDKRDKKDKKDKRDKKSDTQKSDTEKSPQGDSKKSSSKPEKLAVAESSKSDSESKLSPRDGSGESKSPRRHKRESSGDATSDSSPSNKSKKRSKETD